jgi:hypothetical protein
MQAAGAAALDGTLAFLDAPLPFLLRRLDLLGRTQPAILSASDVRLLALTANRVAALVADNAAAAEFFRGGGAADLLRLQRLTLDAEPAQAACLAALAALALRPPAGEETRFAARPAFLAAAAASATCARRSAEAALEAMSRHHLSARVQAGALGVLSSLLVSDQAAAAAELVLAVTRLGDVLDALHKHAADLRIAERGVFVLQAALACRPAYGAAAVETLDARRAQLPQDARFAGVLAGAVDRLLAAGRWAPRDRAVLLRACRALRAARPELPGASAASVRDARAAAQRALMPALLDAGAADGVGAPEAREALLMCRMLDALPRPPDEELCGGESIGCDVLGVGAAVSGTVLLCGPHLAPVHLALAAGVVAMATAGFAQKKAGQRAAGGSAAAVAVPR